MAKPQQRIVEEELSELGLTRGEIKSYLACMKLGTTLAHDIARMAHADRTYTYQALSSLKEKGLISSITNAGKQYFTPAAPERLICILKERERKITALLPELRAMFSTATVERPKIEVYAGKEGLKTVCEDILQTKKNYLVYGPIVQWRKILRGYSNTFRERRIAEGIRSRAITEKTMESLETQKNDVQELREMRFLSYKFPTLTYVYGNKVAVLTLEKETMGIIIEKEEVADTQRLIFENLWNTAKP